MPVLTTALLVSQIAGQGASIGFGLFGAQNAMKVDDTALVEAFNFGIPEFDWPGLHNLNASGPGWAGRLTPAEAARLVSAGDTAQAAVMSKYSREVSKLNWSHTTGWPNFRGQLSGRAAQASVPSLLAGGKAIAAFLGGGGDSPSGEGTGLLAGRVGSFFSTAAGKATAIGGVLLLSVLLFRKA